MPALLSNVAFRNALQAMTVTNVTTHYDYPPESLGELPAAFCTFPGADLGEYVVSCTDQNKTRSMGYVVCVEAVAQDKNEQNYDLLATYMDNLETALDTALGTTANFYEYAMSTDTYTVSGTDYWAVVATVTIRAV